MLVTKINEWLKKEVSLGSPHPDRIVLATAGCNGRVHSRIVAIREITQQGILFFTQAGSRKTQEIAENPYASMTLWLPLQQREIVLEGKIVPLSPSDNQYHWQQRPLSQQLKFTVYSETTNQPITSIQVLEDKLQSLSSQYVNKEVPLSNNYRGYCLIPERCVFYTLNDETFSHVVEYTRHGKVWVEQLLSP